MNITPLSALNDQFTKSQTCRLTPNCRNTAMYVLYRFQWPQVAHSHRGNGKQREEKSSKEKSKGDNQEVPRAR
ncbi:hypothetical protein K0M31_020281 [Melipona bicolor]|uniref:Uncharacterized protein n=1 Tax=Melipona bicolor TaxID=60889 RepID=A0AA40G1G6_9HYME|nr:hypothetical protein K0M31_020281 [Melipona bicolor]